MDLRGADHGLVNFHLVGRDVQARGALQARAVSSCSRCLTPVAVNAEADFNYIYEPDEEAPKGDVAHEGFDSAAPEVAYYRADRIEPLNEMRESLLLALPNIPRCAECEAHPEELVHRVVRPPAADGDAEPEWKRKLRGLGGG